MKIKVIDLTSAEIVNVRAPHTPEFLNIDTREEIALEENEVGFITGKRSSMLVGALCQTGIIHPGFKGKLAPFFVVYGSWTIPVGQKIAHAVIFKGE